MNPITTKIIIDSYEQEISLIFIAIETYGLEKTRNAKDMFPKNWYSRLIECEDNHLQGECVLCMYD